MRFSRLIVCAMAVAALCACSALNDVMPFGSSSGSYVAPVGKDSGVVVADDPVAAQNGATILNEGGSAADAVTATYFSLAVTYSAAAGLGGGGICLVHDAATGRNVEFDFPLGAAASHGSFGVPSNVEGLAALQAGFGRLAWSRDIVPAEKLASLGFLMPGVLETRLLSSEKLVHLDASLASEFLDENGKLKTSASVIVFPELAETLARIRTIGANGFNRGVVGAHIADYTSSQGGAIAEDELWRDRVLSRAPAILKVGNITFVIPRSSSGAAPFLSGALLGNALDRGAAKAIENSLAELRSASDDGGTGFAATDSSGQAVACAVSMNGAFGTGRTVPGTGVTLARAPAGSSSALSLLAPMIASNDSGQVISMGAASGSAEAQNALADAVVHQDRKLDASRLGDTEGSLDLITCMDGSCRPLRILRGPGPPAPTPP